MESALAIWRRRANEPWIRGCDLTALRALVDGFQVGLSAGDRPLQVGLTATDPRTFVAEFLASVTQASPVEIFLGMPPPSIIGSDETRVMIPTGGTTAAPRFAVHTWAGLATAARGLQRWLGDGPIHSVCFLPLHHVSGLMQVVRSFVTGGQLTLATWADVERGEFPAQPEAGAVTSLVPTQLARLFEVSGAVDWLRKFRAVFLGGAPAWPHLLERARRERIPLAPCYGMTETAAQVTAMSPKEFLAGHTGVGRALAHARLEIVDDASAILPSGRAGRVRVRASSLFHGYYPHVTGQPEAYLTNDRGLMNDAGELTVLGRVDAVINSGGEKVDPAEVEAAIRATGLIQDVAVFGLADAEWGEVVIAMVAPSTVEAEAIRARLCGKLAAYKIPKRCVGVAAIPRTDAGKLDRVALRALLE